MQKLYCYVDESGQDIKSEIFVVVAVVSDQEQERLRTVLSEIEVTAKTGHRKWHKSRPDRRTAYLKIVLERSIGKGEVYYGCYKKPLPYFLPLLDVLEKAIKDKAKDQYRTNVYIDGIDRKKAAEITNALRLRNISLEYVRSRRDESEPLIRLADMWAGCIRAVALGKSFELHELLEKAEQERYLKNLTKQNSL